MRGLKLFIGLMLITVQVSVAQQWPFEFWHDGKIILESGDTLRGLLKYDLQQDLVQYDNQRGSVEAFTPRKVLIFEIFDKTSNRYRYFYSLPFAFTGNYRTPIFFELLAEGKMTLLCREAMEYRTFSSPYYYGSYTRLILVYKFYLMEENGNIKEFVGKKNDLLSMMGRQGKDVDSYIKENRLKIEQPEDFARIIVYYNSLFKPK
jgi:hypothetical protein